MKPWEQNYNVESKPWETQYIPKQDIVTQQTQQYTPEQVQAGLWNSIAGGASFGLGDEIQAGFLSPAEYGANLIARNVSDNVQPRSLSDIYDKNLAEARGTLEAVQQERPNAALAANIGGALLTGGLGATTKTGTAIANSLRSGNLAARAGKAGVASAAVGNAVGFGEGEGGAAERLGNAQDMGTSSFLLGAALPVALGLTKGTANATAQGTKNLVTGIKARGSEELADAVSNSKGAAIATKNAAGLSSVKLSPQEANQLISNVDNALANVKLIPEFTPKTIGAIRTLKEDAAKGTLSLNDIDQYRRLLGSASNEDAVAASAVRKALDNSLNSLSTQGRTGASVDLLNQFRKEYSQASKFESVAEIAKKADGDQNKIRRQLTSFMNNEDNLRGWTNEEKLLLKSAAKASNPQKVLRALGTFGFDAGSVKNVALPGLTTVGSFVNPAVGVPLVAGGTAARQADKYIARGKLETLLRALENGQQVTQQQAMALPPSQAKMLLNKIRNTKIKIQDDLPVQQELLALPAPDKVYKAGVGGLPSASYISNAERETAGNLSALGLTPDVQRAQLANQVNSAYSRKQLEEVAQEAASRQALEQLYVNQSILNSSNKGAMTQALQKAMKGKK